MSLTSLTRLTIVVGLTALCMSFLYDRIVKNVQLGRHVDQTMLPTYKRDQDFSQKKYPSLVQLITADKFKGFCSGFVVSDDYMISAAHCFLDADRELEDVEYKIRTVTITDPETALENVLITPVHIVGVSINEDYAILKGDFSGMSKARIDVTPIVSNQVFNRQVVPGLSIPLFALGFARGIKDAVALEQTGCRPIYDYFYCSGIMYHGMSGGPLIDPTNGFVYAINHAIGPQGDTYFKPLIGIFEAFDIVVE